MVYLPAVSTPQLQSFAAPLLNVHDSHVSAPFFGPNVWSAILQPVPGGGIPATHAAVDVKMVFKEGGAFDFHSNFERIKERLQQAVETARESGFMTGDGSESSAGRGGGALSAINLDAVHLEQLPAYEESGRVAPVTHQTSSNQPSSSAQHSALRDSGVVLPQHEGTRPKPTSNQDSSEETFEPPTEPPPGYDEVQQQSVANELESQLRRASR